MVESLTEYATAHAYTEKDVGIAYLKHTKASYSLYTIEGFMIMVPIIQVFLRNTAIRPLYRLKAI